MTKVDGNLLVVRSPGSELIDTVRHATIHIPSTQMEMGTVETGSRGLIVARKTQGRAMGSQSLACGWAYQATATKPMPQDIALAAAGLAASSCISRLLGHPRVGNLAMGKPSTFIRDASCSAEC